LAGALRYGLSLTHAVTRVSEPGGSSDILPVAAPTIGNARISYALPGLLPAVALAARYASPRPGHEYPAAHQPFTPAQLQLRLTLSGELPLPGLSYRLTADYSTSALGPYAVGAIPAEDGERPLIPVDRFRTGVGLQYDFGQ